MEKQPECTALKKCLSIKEYGSNKIQWDWGYFFCPKGEEAYCLSELKKGGVLDLSYTCPIHHVRLVKRHYPKSCWDE
jgi:hypothetical protein